MTRISRLVIGALAIASMHAFTTSATTPLPVQPEVMAAAPAGTTILSFFPSSGGQPADTAVAIFETDPDKDDVRYRTLVVFGAKDGKYVPEFSNDRIIGCSKCTQFHDDPYWSDNVKVTPGHIVIEQGDSGEKSSTTSISLIRRGGVWKIERAVRDTVEGGDGESHPEKLSLPASGLAKDLDAKWNIPVFYNAIIVNNVTGKFTFQHKARTPDAVWDGVKGRCNKQDCSVLVQQQDGCISLVQDAAARSFGAGTPDHRNKAAASDKAMAACKAAGGQKCEVIRTDCTKGI
ncbi:DUF4189 domain-containing protein [Bacillus sp. NP157]|nr:DUF4189 domain-containing protein [Bacillus sp. NP157]